ncbi:MAG: hypothetical protein VW455_00940, partial [Nitrospinota bacterium]
SKAGAADSKAGAALSKADQALSAAGAADSKASSALSRAGTADSKAGAALSKADSALSAAGAADSKASSALSKAGAADSKAGAALSKADSALSAAGAADSKASSALSRASTADSKAGAALSKANSAQATADQALSTAQSNGVKISYRIGTNVEDSRDNGFLNGRILSFNKNSATSLLRISYNDNLRVAGPVASACQWQIWLENQLGNRSTGIYTTLYNTSTVNNPATNSGVQVNSHRQSTVTGILSGVPKGSNTIRVRVARSPLGGNPNGDCHTGWWSSYFLEVQEFEP